MQDLAKKLHAAFAEAVARPATHPSGKNQDDHNAMVKQCVDGLARLSDDHRRHVDIGPAPDALTRYGAVLLDQMIDSDLAHLVADLWPELHWYEIFSDPSISEALSRGLISAPISGIRGQLVSEELISGMFLLAPHTHYPLHQHPALEIYYVLSGAVDICHGRNKSPMHINAGDYSLTPPNQVHSLTTGDTPCLIIFTWTSDLANENWWWDEQDGIWMRTCWQRDAKGTWKIALEEPLSNDVIAQSGDA
jgi:quercetin dioxygenase-like cupin family protein